MNEINDPHSKYVYSGYLLREEKKPGLAIF